MNWTARWIIPAISLVCCASAATAQWPLNYQGRLTDPNGIPVTNKAGAMRIAIYAAPSGGSPVYTEIIGTVEIKDGLYSFDFGGSSSSSSTVVTQTVATTDGANSTFAGTLTRTPVVSGTVTISDGVKTWTDIGGGSSSAGFSCTVDYMLGQVEAVYTPVLPELPDTVPPAGRSIVAIYSYSSATTNLIDALALPQVWLEVAIDGAPLTPRRRITAAPYAIMAETLAGSSLRVAPNGYVGIGTILPAERLHVWGNILATGTVTAARFAGDGSRLANISGGSVVVGSISNISISDTAAIAPNKIAGTALTADTLFDGDVSGLYSNLALKSGVVDSNELAAGAVGTINLQSGAVTSNELAGFAVGTDALADAAVVSNKLASAAVGTDALQDLAVTTAKIADGAVTAAKLSVNTVAPPIGSVMAWLKSYANAPTLPDGWVECSGQTLSDAGSLFNGQIIPDLNGVTDGTHKFIRGAATSGGTGGTESHGHNLKLSLSGGNYEISIRSGKWRIYDDAQNNLPSFYEAVWIMRVK